LCCRLGVVCISSCLTGAVSTSQNLGDASFKGLGTFVEDRVEGVVGGIGAETCEPKASGNRPHVGRTLFVCVCGIGVRWLDSSDFVEMAALMTALCWEAAEGSGKGWASAGVANVLANAAREIIASMTSAL